LLAKRGKPARVSQILLMQKVLLQNATSPDVKPVDQAKCALAWERLEERAMILRGHGRPKPVDARNATPKRKRETVTPIAPANLTISTAKDNGA